MNYSDYIMMFQFCVCLYQNAVSPVETPIWGHKAAALGLCRYNCCHQNFRSPSNGSHIWVSMEENTNERNKDRIYY